MSVGGTGVLDGVYVDVAVGGTGVSVGVTGVAVGGTGVSVGVLVGVCVGVAVARGAGIPGGMGVAADVAKAGVPKMSAAIASTPTNSRLSLIVTVQALLRQIITII